MAARPCYQPNMHDDRRALQRASSRRATDHPAPPTCLIKHCSLYSDHRSAYNERGSARKAKSGARNSREHVTCSHPWVLISCRSALHRSRTGICSSYHGPPSAADQPSAACVPRGLTCTAAFLFLFCASLLRVQGQAHWLPPSRRPSRSPACCRFQICSSAELVAAVKLPWGCLEAGVAPGEAELDSAKPALRDADVRARRSDTHQPPLLARASPRPLHARRLAPAPARPPPPPPVLPSLTPAAPSPPTTIVKSAPSHAHTLPSAQNVYTAHSAGMLTQCGPAHAPQPTGFLPAAHHQFYAFSPSHPAPSPSVMKPRGPPSHVPSLILLALLPSPGPLSPSFAVNPFIPPPPPPRLPLTASPSLLRPAAALSLPSKQSNTSSSRECHRTDSSLLCWGGLAASRACPPVDPPPGSRCSLSTLPVLRFFIAGLSPVIHQNRVTAVTPSKAATPS